MPSTIKLYQIGVWFCVGIFTGAGCPCNRTNQTGLTANSTRTVLIAALNSPPPPPISDTTATASSTEATSTPQ